MAQRSCDICFPKRVNIVKSQKINHNNWDNEVVHPRAFPPFATLSTLSSSSSKTYHLLGILNAPQINHQNNRGVQFFCFTFSEFRRDPPAQKSFNSWHLLLGYMGLGWVFCLPRLIPNQTNWLNSCRVSIFNKLCFFLDFVSCFCHKTS